MARPGKGDRVTGRLVAASGLAAHRVLSERWPSMAPRKIKPGPMGGMGLKVDVHLLEVDALHVPMLLADVSGATIVAPMKLSPLHVDVREMPWDTLLLAVAEALGLKLEKVRGSSLKTRGGSFRLVPRMGEAELADVRSLPRPTGDSFSGDADLEPLYDPGIRVAAIVTRGKKRAAVLAWPGGAWRVVQEGYIYSDLSTTVATRVTVEAERVVIDLKDKTVAWPLGRFAR